MEENAFLQWRKKDTNFLVVMALLLLLTPIASPLNDEGKALMAIKASFSNVANVLLGWNDDHDGDFCSWRGVICDNVSLSVVSLNLKNNQLTGPIPSTLSQIPNLKTL
ncbi:hypothetical protein L484_012962 [Morus notabilis]|uniref:Leucine-rich repeat-containing N-terminal plant-type domain-containing protein n=1 Tax=Morus notabilis TaxID=981085 RepID=W9S9G5_9ROSA|nr:hypothetical protein L484_012962 [Morus notabilis]